MPCESSGFSNVCTRKPIPVRAWGWRSQSGSSSATAAAFGPSRRGKAAARGSRSVWRGLDEPPMNAPLLILLAEDNAGDVLLIRRALESHQVECKLIVAEDGDKVTAILARIGQDLPAPDVLILDLNLPRMDGRDMFQRVRAHPACSRTPL